MHNNFLPSVIVQYFLYKLFIYKFQINDNRKTEKKEMVHDNQISKYL